MDEVRKHMSKFELNLALLGVVLFMGLGIAIADETSQASQNTPSCAVTKYAVPGDTFSLAGPTPPSGVSYTYLWTVADANNNQVLTAATQNTQYQVPTTSPTSYYVATLSVGSGTSTSGQITGCVLQSCLLISVQLSNTCGVSGAQSVCQTDNAEVYSYTGTADITNKKTSYLKWIVDTTTITSKDNSGQTTVDWTKFWSTTSGSGAQTHNVIVEVHSAKGNTLLSTCTYPVTVLPSPVTTITTA
jgi:hypothetical protein